jgi:hypothetical protein
MNNTIYNDNQFYILLSTMIINTIISVITPLISAIILCIRRIEKSKCLGGEVILTKNKSNNNLNNIDNIKNM